MVLENRFPPLLILKCWIDLACTCMCTTIHISCLVKCTPAFVEVEFGWNAQIFCFVLSVLSVG